MSEKEQLIYPEDYESKKDCIKEIYELFGQLFNDLEIICEQKQHLFTAETTLDKIMSKVSQVRTAKKIVQQTDANLILNHYKEKVLPHKQYIIERNEDFFIEKNDLYFNLPEGMVLFVKELFKRTEKENGLNRKQRKAIWDYAECIVILVERHEELKE